MLGTPGRRRRLIQAFAPSNAEKYYTSVPSTKSGSSFLRRRTQTKSSGDARKRPSGARSAKSKTTAAAAASTGFRPIDPKADHGYRIDVAKDGSMITAVPMEERPLPSRGVGVGVGGIGSAGAKFEAPHRPSRGASSSPILFGQPRSSPNAGSDGSAGWSQQGLLDARGKQRHKMRRMRPVVAKTKDAAAVTKRSPIIQNGESFPNDPFNNVVHTARDKLKHAKGFAAFTGTNDNSAQHQPPRRKPDKPPARPKQQFPRSRSKATKVRWDLSPKRQGQPQQQPRSQRFQTAGGYAGNYDDADASFSSFPLLSGHKFDDSIDDVEEEKKNSNDNAADIKNNNSANNKDGRNGTKANMTPKQKDDTLSFEALLKKREADIQSQQKEIAAKISQKDIIKGTLISAIDGNLERNRKRMMALEEELEEIQLRLKHPLSEKKQPRRIARVATKNRQEVVAGARRARSPIGAFDMDSVDAGDPSITADTDSIAALLRKDSAGRVTLTGLDPPARRSPPTIKEEMHLLNRRERKEPDGSRISAVLRGNNTVHARANANRNSDRVIEPIMRIPSPPSVRSVPPTPKPAPYRPAPLQLHYQHNENSRQRHHLWQQKKSAPPPQSPKRGKFVHFNLPDDSESAELKFESTNSTDSPSKDFAGTTNGDDEEEVSWKEEHFDVGAYNKEAVSSEHHDIYQWTEHNSRENHHRLHYHRGAYDESPLGSSNQNNHNGVSSGSVETDPDLGFIHAVAAVVIQTAVRRFLANIAVEERLYAVNVIQTIICNWMARIKRDPYSNSGEIFNDDQNSDRITHDEQNHPKSFSQRPTQRTKHVMFEDDYNDFRDYAATEIQRCYRGWWARDGFEVDHFAATTIQRLFRGWWAREALDVDRYCAVEIQRIVRGHLSRMSYIYNLYCIIVVQSVVRRYLAFYTSAVRLANILYIQAIFRGYRVRAGLMRYVRNGQEVAATFIQSQWRSYDTRMNYINTLADILIVQSVARRWLTLRNTRRRIDRKPTHYDMGYGQPRANYNRSDVTNARENTHTNWQQHRMNVVSRPVNPPAVVGQYSRPEDYDVFHRDSVAGEEWFDGNKSETSDMLKSWRGRKSK